MGELAGKWLLEDSRFDALDETLAWYGLTLLEKSLAYRDADFCLALPKRIKNHPQLGLAAMLTLWPPLGSGGRAELEAFEETVARMARDAFLADDSSPAVLALASARLAATKPIVETFAPSLFRS